MFRQAEMVLALGSIFAAGAAMPAWAHGTTERVSVSSGGTQADGPSSNFFAPAISADGRFVAFGSEASNLVPADTNDFEDVFVHDRRTGKTRRVSLGPGGVQGNFGGSTPTISADGRFVAFESFASNLVPGDTNGFDVFVRDRKTDTTERVNLGPGGVQANGSSYDSFPAISADGRFVAFWSLASNLVPGDTNGEFDVFVRDRQTGTTRRVSLGPGGVQANGPNSTSPPAISADGRFVAFNSDATNLVPGDTNNGWDIFVHDRQTGTTRRVSVGPGGVQADGFSRFAAISADGRFVAFHSFASNLVPGGTNGALHVFVHDRQTGKNRLVSVGSSGAQGNDSSISPAISADGRFVAFSSDATNLVPGDTNGQFDMFVHDRRTGKIRRVSLGPGGVQADGLSDDAAISADGRFVAFWSGATNLVPGDTNSTDDIFVRILAP